jgi:hypothetical protein
MTVIRANVLKHCCKVKRTLNTGAVRGDLGAHDERHLITSLSVASCQASLAAFNGPNAPLLPPPPPGPLSPAEGSRPPGSQGPGPQACRRPAEEVSAKARATQGWVVQRQLDIP